MEFMDTSAAAQTTPEVKRIRARNKKDCAKGINPKIETNKDPKYKQEYLLPILEISVGAIKNPINTPNGCMNKANDRSIKLKPIVALTSGILSNQRDKPRD